MTVSLDRLGLDPLEAELRHLRDALVGSEQSMSGTIAATHPSHRRSAANLVHYVELRHHDVRKLQARLGALGMSSLGRSEACVLANVEAVLAVICRLNGTAAPGSDAGIELGEGQELLSSNAAILLGPSPSKRSSRIMVTMPSEAADDRDLVSAMVHGGMDIARINCAHDDHSVWARMIETIRSAADDAGRACLIAMDLAGPKLRTGPLQPGPRVVRIAPRRDPQGRVVEPALVRLTTAEHREERASDNLVGIPVDDAEWLSRRAAGERVELTDGRGARRRWTIVKAGASGCIASTERTSYVVTGLTLVCQRPEGDDATTVGELPEREQAHDVAAGDRVILTRSLEPSPPTSQGRDHLIGCTLPEVFARVRPGHAVWLDDGKIGGKVDHVAHDRIELVVTDVRPGGVKLRAGKGINLPDTKLSLGALTEKDRQDLEFVACHADLVNLSFVRRPEDVEELLAELARLEASDIGIVLKIENVAAFEHLPELLLAAMHHEKVGVMIARGDLAVEVGFDRLAEVQEEIMWACEAAHVPVIWATQVLDTLARTGQPSRAEVTDAAMSERAECVMLNKGPHIASAIAALDSILTRMQHHQHKKRSLLRRLRAWDRASTEQAAT